GLARPRRQDAGELSQRRDEVDVGHDRIEELGLDEELAEIEPREGVLLEDADDLGRKVGADVAEPARHRRSRAAEAALAVGGAEARERAPAGAIGRAEVDVGAVGAVAAEDQAPAFQTIRHCTAPRFAGFVARAFTPRPRRLAMILRRRAPPARSALT